MNFQDVISQYWPCWMLGLWMIYFTWAAGHKDLIKVDFKAILKFLRWMIPITILRILWLKFYISQGGSAPTKEMVDMIPVAATLGVFWEDACFTLPLVLLSTAISQFKWYSYISKILLLLTMVSFGSGHLYQGPFMACAISFYIPYTMKLAKKFGFGTVMICHILFDLISLSAIKWMVGGF